MLAVGIHIKENSKRSNSDRKHNLDSARQFRGSGGGGGGEEENNNKL